MGVINTTPDSFSDGGKFDSTEKAFEHAQQLIFDGADILDVGGESTRPGSRQVDLEEELDRTIPLIVLMSAIDHSVSSKLLPSLRPLHSVPPVI